jgi:spore photoproduct lyase
MPELKHQQTKTLQIKPNGRSSDFVTPNFIYGCAGGCRNSYCYVMRYNYDTVFINDNSAQILAAIAAHADTLAFPKPNNQVDPTFWTYDIGCATDISLHWKHYDWRLVFDFFCQHPKIKATFATKYVNKQLLEYSPQQGKIRIRFSLMPQKLSSILEPKTTPIAIRIAAITEFAAAGYEVHVNFSPIVVYENWLADYRELFDELDTAVPAQLKPTIKAECIFLTHNAWQHERNLAQGLHESENILWQPYYQEQKRSEYGSEAVRYHHHLKANFIQQWRKLQQACIPWNDIRYIF